ncbi:MAG: AbrB/MazE/SpoVT family DNA-binding domain-containing protein [Chromatiales bacterium]|jgi:AbrB family looped-hinge helix DNA binding protein|nr:AbrB/MazE/SpoVT family DNA-binding domain-containing protein [Chromatiales bacterium]
METTRLSSKGQVIIPKAVRAAHGWETGVEFTVIDTGEGVLLKPRAPFEPTTLGDVAGLLRDRVAGRTEAQIKAALERDVRERWRGSR